jgi:hypothetical protein
MPRREPRHPVHKQVKVADRDLTSLTDCELVDISAAGARLRSRALNRLPDAVILVFTKEQIIRQAEVRWRKSTEIGVEFTDLPRRFDPANS